MKVEMKRSVVQFEDENQRVVGEDFGLVFGRAFLIAFTVDTVKAAFSATGIFPFNPGVICPEQLVPAEAMSIKGSFTLTQTSLIRAIMTTFRTYQPTLFDTSPSHALLPSSVQAPIASLSCAINPPSPVTTPKASGSHPNRRSCNDTE
ncbi:hypothetical protein BT96DRAFT_1008430 [Gymnopus androsaceus JB14]|uniref:Uncharacterized protein n=1 Tax=Gymnopus androsaceus JB14 TaxID=1447944 RepID=A0A6A4GFA6_9AGAR|nr:hypothetical protein BT96DRAFT_1008430 [Gymnopus androsaceus JB14]